MARGIHSTLNFNGGVVSSKLDARVDSQKYGSWLRQCLNMIPYKTGGLTRAPGTQYVAVCKQQAVLSGTGYAVKLASFTFSPTTQFILEFGDQYIRFYTGGDTPKQVTVSSAQIWVSGTSYPPGTFVEDSGAGDAIYYSAGGITGSTTEPHSDPTNWIPQTIYEVPSPYPGQYHYGTAVPAETAVYQIVPCQINDVIYIVHPDYPPYSLSRFGDTDWVMEQVPFDTPALLDQNATDTIITPSALQGAGITLTASAPAWIEANSYSLADSVEVDGIIYDCILANVSGSTFSADLALGYWQPVGIFNPLHIGSTWQLAVLSNSAYLEYDGTADDGFTQGYSATIQCLGTFTVNTYGVWSGDAQIQRSLDNGNTWVTVMDLTSRDDANYTETGTALQLGLYRIYVSNVAAPATPGATNPRIVFQVANAFLYGLVEITAVAVIAASAMVNGTAYQIQTLGSTNWSAIGATVNAAVGTIFTYNGASVTGSGGTVFNPYVATGDVIAQLNDPNPTQLAWVYDNTYNSGIVATAIDPGEVCYIQTLGSTDFTTIGAPSNTVGIIFTATGAATGSGTVADVCSYGFVNYFCIESASGDTITPPQDPTHWTPLAPGGTSYWSEAAWSNYRGFPQAVTCFQQRMIYASSGFQPQRIWGTVTNDIQNFFLGDQTLATDAFAFDVNAPARGPIQWLISQTDLFAGFSGAEWVINSGSTNSAGGGSGAAISPSNINAFEQGTYGSAPGVQPYIVGNAALFVQRQANAVRQMLFSVYTQKYMSQDLTSVAEQLFDPGILQMAYQASWRHQGMLWAVTGNGELAGITYDLDQEVFGWCQRQTGFNSQSGGGGTDPGFQSIASIDGNGTSSDEDELWAVVTRVVYGIQFNYIERVNPSVWEHSSVDVPGPPLVANAFYVDCGSTILNPNDGLVIAGLPQLEGRQVVGLADGNAFGPLVVTDGAVTLPESMQTPVGIVQIGLPIPYAGQPMRFDQDPREGNTQARTKQAYEWYIRVWYAMGGMLSNGTSTYPAWVSGVQILAGTNVISPATLGAYQCVVSLAGAVNTTDPSQSTNFVAIPLPSYQPPIPIPYTANSANPFAVPVLVTTPTDIKLPSVLQPSPDTDPVVVIQGADALPLTVLGLFLKYNVLSEP